MENELCARGRVARIDGLIRGTTENTIDDVLDEHA